MDPGFVGTKGYIIWLIFFKKKNINYKYKFRYKNKYSLSTKKGFMTNYWSLYSPNKSHSADTSLGNLPELLT